MMIYSWTRDYIRWNFSRRDLEYYVVVGMRWRKHLSISSLL